MGGEISIKLFFEELGILQPERRELLREITRQLHELLYERKLVGYSKTSLVFGRDRSLAQVLETLEPLFLSENICTLVAQRAPEVGAAELRLGCTKGNELVYVVQRAEVSAVRSPENGALERQRTDRDCAEAGLNHLRHGSYPRIGYAGPTSNRIIQQWGFQATECTTNRICLIFNRLWD